MDGASLAHARFAQLYTPHFLIQVTHLRTKDSLTCAHIDHILVQTVPDTSNSPAHTDFAHLRTH